MKDQFPSLCGVFLLVVALQGQPVERVDALWQMHCAACHGSDMQGGAAESLLNGNWNYGERDEDLARIIRDGNEDQTMPGFGEAFTEEQIRALVVFIREREDRALPLPSPERKEAEVYSTEEHSYQIESIVDGLSIPWAITFLPDGSYLVTERPGRLLRISPSGESILVEGTPPVAAVGQGGMLDVVLHPDYEENGWVYLSFSDPGEDGSGALTAVVRGRLDGNQWVDEEEIFRAPHEQYHRGGAHFGSRIAFDDQGYLYFTIGDRGRMMSAQDLSLASGKTHRLHADGSIPQDNPFVDDDGAMDSIWTYGNRNAQGLAWDFSTNQLWSTEHGPRGGDELNLLERDGNYGWPLVTHGINYNGTPITEKTEAPGMVSPVVHWTPSIAVCGLTVFDNGSLFPRWEGNLFAGGLAGQQVRRMVLDGNEVIHQEIIFRDQGRVRDVRTGPNGHLYIVLNQPDRVIRLKPANASTSVSLMH